MISDQIRKVRTNLGFTQKELSEYLDLPNGGERTIRGWESGEHLPTSKRLAEIFTLQRNVPFRCTNTSPLFKFIDLFAGIGGIRLPFQDIGGRCVFSSEWDKFAKKTYTANFGELPYGDITQISAYSIPDHDLLVAGFPCQAFSQAGLKQGFADTRGTMFFEIQRILAAKQPRVFLLENVKQLKGHDKGRTLKTIVDILEGEYEGDMPSDLPLSDEARKCLSNKLDYSIDYRVLRACDYGIPQNRERIYIVGFNRKYYPNIDTKTIFKWPEPLKQKTRLGDILEDNKHIDDKYTISDRLWAGHRRRKEEHKIKGNGFGYSLFNKESPYTNTISARYYKDGSEILIDQTDIGKNPRKLTPRECARLQGFPEEFIVDAVSSVQIYKQFGNSVAMPVIRRIANSMLEIMKH